MYGLINIAIKDLVTENYSSEAWERIRKKAGLPDTPIILMEQYEDSVTFDLVAAASEELGITPSQVLQAFGAYWTKYTAEKGYGPLMDSAGTSFPEFLRNLDLMHTRVGTMFPDFIPPSFKCENVTDNTLDLHYYSERDGLDDLVIGLLHGLADRFDLKLEIEQLKAKGAGSDHSVFHVCWT